MVKYRSGGDRDTSICNSPNLDMLTTLNTPRFSCQVNYRQPPKKLNLKSMDLGANPKNDFERITKSMFDNNRCDAVPSQRTLNGQDIKVMNLRPLDKSKHLDNC